MNEPLHHRIAPATGVAHTLYGDYETRSTNMPKVGVDKYAAAPSTQALRYAVADGPVLVSLIPLQRMHFREASDGC